MANDFYNVNIHKYDPAMHANRGNNANAENNQQSYTAPHLPAELLNPQQAVSSEPSSHARLNALDAKILIDEAYKGMDDETFVSEYRITKLEDEIKSLDKEIKSAKAINDFQKADILIMRKHSCQSKLKELYAKYNKSDVTTKLSGGLTAILNKKPTFISDTISKCADFISEKILTKISKKYSSGQDIKQALSKLETLNKNVDELVTMQMPYGEADERYDMLSEYLNRANVIHFNISKTVGTPTFFDTISSIDKEKYTNAEKSKRNKSNFGRMTGRPGVNEEGLS